MGSSESLNNDRAPLFRSITIGIPIETIPVEETFPTPRTIREKYPKVSLLQVRDVCE